MHSSCVSIRRENTAVLVAAWIFLLYSCDGGIPRVRVQNFLMEMCKTSSFWLWPHKALKRTRQKSLRPPSCCGDCSQRQWLTGTNNPPYCLLYIELSVHHGTPWISLTVYCRCVYVLSKHLQSSHSPAVRRAQHPPPLLTNSECHLFTQSAGCVFQKSPAYQNYSVFNMQCLLRLHVFCCNIFIWFLARK